MLNYYYYFGGETALNIKVITCFEESGWCTKIRDKEYYANAILLHVGKSLKTGPPQDKQESKPPCKKVRLTLVFTLPEKRWKSLDKYKGSKIKKRNVLEEIIIGNLSRMLKPHWKCAGVKPDTH